MFTIWLCFKVIFKVYLEMLKKVHCVMLCMLLKYYFCCFFVAQGNSLTNYKKTTKFKNICPNMKPDFIYRLFKIEDF